MHWRLGKMLAVCAASTFLAVGCSPSRNGALPAGASDGSASRANTLVYTFRVKNDTDVTLSQVLLKSYCMARTPGNADIAANATSDVLVEVDRDSKCPVASAFTEGYEMRGGPSDQRAEFAFDYIGSKSPSGELYFGANARGWNGLCATSIRDEAANTIGIHIFQGRSPKAGCYSTGARSQKPTVPFKLKIENLTSLGLSARTAFSLCMEGMPSGSVPPGTTTFNMRTIVGKATDWCDYGAEFFTTLDVAENGHIVTIGGIQWRYRVGSPPTIHAIGFPGYCGAKLNSEVVRFAKSDVQQC